MCNIVKNRINEQSNPVLSGSLLHEFLKEKESHTDWYIRMKRYGFSENLDCSILSAKSDKFKRGYTSTDQKLSLFQITEKENQENRYFCELSKLYSLPVKRIERDLILANKEINKNCDVINTITRQRKKNYV
jgi:phage anti-repressor protein